MRGKIGSYGLYTEAKGLISVCIVLASLFGHEKREGIKRSVFRYQLKNVGTFVLNAAAWAKTMSQSG